MKTLLLATTLIFTPVQGEFLSNWFGNLYREDGVSCCGLADALWGEWIGTKEGHYIVEVVGGGPREHEWAPIGAVYAIPNNMVVWRHGNPFGRPIIFLRPWKDENGVHQPICFIPAGGV
jgi:hypothetical protein